VVRVLVRRLMVALMRVGTRIVLVWNGKFLLVRGGGMVGRKDGRGEGGKEPF
jgi:hypothetical protein